MKHTAHTPGPWTYRTDIGSVCFNSHNQPTHDGKPRGQIHDMSDGQTWNGGMLPIDERAANARLIAAAPDMLAACKRAEAYMSRLVKRATSPAGHELAELRAIISKAEGRA